MSYPLTCNQQYNVSASVEIRSLTSHSPLAERDIRPFARLTYCSHPMTKKNNYCQERDIYFMSTQYSSTKTSKYLATY